SSLAWQLLGWAQYRAGNWKDSIEALNKSCKLQPGGTGDGGQWIVLALAHEQLAGDRGLAEAGRAGPQAGGRRRYRASGKQIDSRRGSPDAIGQAISAFRAEAAKLLDGKE